MPYLYQPYIIRKVSLVPNMDLIPIPNSYEW